MYGLRFPNSFEEKQFFTEQTLNIKDKKGKKTFRTHLHIMTFVNQVFLILFPVNDFCLIYFGYFIYLFNNNYVLNIHDVFQIAVWEEGAH